MKALAAAIFLVLIAVSPSRGDQSGVIVRTALDPAAGMVVGQRVNLRITVLFPGQMPYPPRVSVPDVPGMQVMLLETQGTTVVDHVGGSEYVGKQFEFATFPRRGGHFAIPAPAITLLDPTGGTVGSARGNPTSMDVAWPAGIDSGALVTASAKVTAVETWSPAPKAGFKAGGALVRTITREVDDVPALAMRDFAFAAPEGVRAYVDPPEADDRTNRGTLTGRRVDRVTYVFEKPGSYDLPPLSQPWWDLAAKAAKSADLAGISVVVTQPPAASTQARQGTAGRERLALLIMAGAILVVLALLGAGWRRLRRRWLDLRRRRAESEPAARRGLRRIARSGDAAATYAALRTWVARLPEKNAAEVFTAHDDLARLAGELEAALFGGPDATWTPGQGRRLAAAVGSLRLRATPGARPMSALPPLNPAMRSPEL